MVLGGIFLWLAVLLLRAPTHKRFGDALLKSAPALLHPPIPGFDRSAGGVPPASQAPTQANTTAQDIWAVLSPLTDPEIPVVSLRDMGILRDVRRVGGEWHVVITPTYSGCPAMEQIEDDVRSTLQQLGVPVRVTTRLSPAWTTDWMTDAAREKLRGYGIAPPGRCAPTGLNVVQFAPRSASPTSATAPAKSWESSPACAGRSACTSPRRTMGVRTLTAVSRTCRRWRSSSRLNREALGRVPQHRSCRTRKSMHSWVQLSMGLISL
jgi:ring-1,2-phenylacetyl-CoA epoxidase subunit PaaD